MLAVVVDTQALLKALEERVVEELLLEAPAERQTLVVVAVHGMERAQLVAQVVQA